MRHPDDGLIEEYLDGELAAEARPGFEAHAAGCETCRERIEAARAARSESDELVALLGEPEPRPTTEELPASLQPPARQPIRWRTVAWAASLVLAAGLGYVGGTADRHADAPTRGRAESPSLVGRTEEPADRRTDALTDAAASPAPRPAVPPSGAAAEEATVRTAPPSAEFGAPLAKARTDTSEAPALDGPVAGRAMAVGPPNRQAAEPHSPTLADAVRALGGSIRLVDGLEVQRVEVAWLPMPGGDSAAVVELSYTDAAGHPIVLRQSRTAAVVGELAAADAVRREAAAPRAYAPGAAVAQRAAAKAGAEAEARDGELSWLDAGGFRLVLRADADADSLARLRARVR